MKTVVFPKMVKKLKSENRPLQANVRVEYTHHHLSMESLRSCPSCHHRCRRHRRHLKFLRLQQPRQYVRHSAVLLARPGGFDHPAPTHFLDRHVIQALLGSSRYFRLQGPGRRAGYAAAVPQRLPPRSLAPRPDEELVVRHQEARGA